ncbi:MAG: cytochrome D ubiquinol oxidase subunit II [Nitrospirales bacterium]|nr:MAG: cytochrome D ubiquinol oxidase subunit II [Nitrospirales bacterium]
MIDLEVILALALLIALTFYALMGGADYGAGVWHLLARGATRGKQHKLIGEAIGPVWEANHVWLILIVTILFTAFPTAYAQISVTLHIPLTLLVIGIVLRGSAYAFRHYDIQDDELHVRWDQLFALASLMSPLLLGIIIGSITAGNFPRNPTSFLEGYVSNWIQPFPLAVGLLTLVLFAYLAAVYLILETQDIALQEMFRSRAIVAALLTGVIGEVVFFLGQTDAPDLWGDIINSIWGRCIMLGTIMVTISAIWFLVTRRYWWARTCAIFQVILTLWAWGIAQFPYLVPPHLTIYNSSSPTITLQFMVLALVAGAVLLFPSLYYLLRIFKGGPLLGFLKRHE